MLSGSRSKNSLVFLRCSIHFHWKSWKSLSFLMISNMKRKKSYDFLRFCIDVNRKLKRIIIFFLCFLTYSNDFLIPMPVPNPFDFECRRYSKEKQKECTWSSRRTRRDGHDASYYDFRLQTIGQQLFSGSHLSQVQKGHDILGTLRVW